MHFPVWSRAISAKGTIKATLGNVNTPVICAGALVHAGDAVIADDDGVVVVPHNAVAATIAASEERALREEKKRARLAAGELGMDIEKMRPKLKELGLTYYDKIDQVPD
jgi:4-hydroxy-4-methyl-2-oxoglutarate aldolase